METLILTMPLILVAFARVIEACALVVLARRAGGRLELDQESRAAPKRLRLRARLRARE